MERENQPGSDEIAEYQQPTGHHEFDGSSRLMELSVLFFIVFATLAGGFGMSLLIGALI